MEVINKNTPTKKLMSISEAAKHFGVSQYFLRQGIKNKNLPYIQNGKKYYLCVDGLAINWVCFLLIFREKCEN